MRGAYLDRVRAGRLMREAGVDALACLQPENIQYATGAHPGVATLFRRAGAAIALVPADDGLAPGAVMPDLAMGAVRRGSDLSDVRYLPIWVGTTRLTGVDAAGPIAERLAAGLVPALERPSTFDQQAGFGHLRDMLAERGLLSGIIGVEMEFLPVADFTALREAIPEARFVDGSAIMRRLRMVKSEREIAMLRTGLELSEAALKALLPEIRPGAARDALGDAFLRHVKAQAQARGVTGLSSAWEYISVGPDPWGAPRSIAPGDVVKVDVGAVIAGYSSDCARTFVSGKASSDQKAVHAALKAGFDTGLPMMRSDVRLADVHAAMIARIRKAGLPGYARGHFGHGLGQSLFSEEWPFIAADSDVAIEPGMVLALEAPYYIDGLGGFIIEDQVLVTADGPQTMNTLSRELVEL